MFEGNYKNTPKVKALKIKLQDDMEHKNKRFLNRNKKCYLMVLHNIIDISCPRVCAKKSAEKRSAAVLNSKYIPVDVICSIFRACNCPTQDNRLG